MRQPRASRNGLWVGVVALVAGVSSLGCKSQSHDGGARITLTPCRPKGMTEEVKCGTLEVPENRETGQGRRISLHVAVMPALAPSPEPDPVFFLAGGPGQAAAKLAGAIYPMVEKLHHTRDIVFVDQRGTGDSSPLACPSAEDAGLADRFSESYETAGLRRCLADYRDAGIDATQFTTPIAMDDLEDVRSALGYPRINLFGVSYGTRAALTYLARHPEHVRTLVLDGVAPPSMSLLVSNAENADRAFRLTFDQCAKDAACAQAFPDLAKKFSALLARLEAHPVHTTVLDPTSGVPTPLTLSRVTFVQNLHGMLYQPAITALLPLIIDRANEGDFSPFVAQAVGTGAMGDSINVGMFFSVLCAEDAPRATPELIAEHTKGTFFGAEDAHALQEVCKFWPRGQVTPRYYEPVHSATPVLLLSGELDPVTPPSRAEEARVGLSRSVAVVAPGSGHMIALSGCVPKLVAKFLEQGNADGLPVDCVKGLSRPPFFVSFAGPKP